MKNEMAKEVAITVTLFMGAVLSATEFSASNILLSILIIETSYILAVLAQKIGQEIDVGKEEIKAIRTAKE